MITVVGWPRSGTHWLKAMLEHALGEEVGQSHHWPEATDGEYVLIVRDPRDVFASHWRLYRHDNPGTAMQELEFVNYFMKGEGLEQPWGVGWVPHTRRLMALSETYPIVLYEQLFSNTVKELSWILIELGVGFPLSYIETAVHCTQAQRCDPSDLPVDAEMGIPGKWQRQLRVETVAAITVYCGELMDELGYTR